MKMTGNTVLITGGGSGIGRGLAEALHRLGNKVTVAGRRRSQLDAVVAANPGIDAVELDITDPVSIVAVAERLIRDYPTLNVLVNNAGIMPFDDAAGVLDDAVSQTIVATNFLGPIRLTSGKRPPSLLITHIVIKAGRVGRHAGLRHFKQRAVGIGKRFGRYR